MNNMGQTITADAKVNTLSIGARYERRVELGKSGSVIPFAGVRYTFLKTNDYSNSWGTQYSVDNQHLFQIPIGVKWTGEFAMPKSAWSWKPAVEAGYNWNIGGRDRSQTVYTNGQGTNVDFDVADAGTYYLKIGSEIKHRNVTLGVSYRYSKSENIRNNKWSVNMSWSF